MSQTARPGTGVFPVLLVTAAEVIGQRARSDDPEDPEPTVQDTDRQLCAGTLDTLSRHETVRRSTGAPRSIRL
uniref:Putative secreted peptide n=1 Tax=Anopheles braziliensis TaxID=58242 RepID=A0A2M3ZWW9_9DIPT